MNGTDVVIVWQTTNSFVRCTGSGCDLLTAKRPTDWCPARQAIGSPPQVHKDYEGAVATAQTVAAAAGGKWGPARCKAAACMSQRIRPLWEELQMRAVCEGGYGLCAHSYAVQLLCGNVAGLQGRDAAGVKMCCMHSIEGV